MTAVPLHRVARRARAALGFAIALARGLSGARGVGAARAPAGADQHDIELPGSESALRDAAGIRVVGPDPEGHAQSHRTVHPVADLGQRGYADLRAATGARLPGRRACRRRPRRSRRRPVMPIRSRARPCGRASAIWFSSPSSTRSIRIASTATSISRRARASAQNGSDLSRGRSTRIRTACTHRARRTSTSTGPTPARARPATMSICRSVRCRATIRAT